MFQRGWCPLTFRCPSRSSEQLTAGATSSGSLDNSAAAGNVNDINTEHTQLQQQQQLVDNIDPSHVDQDGRNAVHVAVLVALRDATSEAAASDQLQATSADSPASLALDQAVKAGCDVNSVDWLGRRPIHYAAEAGHVTLLRQLLFHSVDPNAFSQPTTTDVGDGSGDSLSPLMLAALNGRVAAVKALLENGATVAELANNRARTALHYAAASSDVTTCASVIEILAGRASDRDAFINCQDCEGSTALMFAARNKRPTAAASAVSILIKLGANVNLVDSQGRSAVHWAAQSNLPEVVSLLHAASADLDAVDSHGDTAYVTAIKADSPDALQSLITAGCDTCTIDGLMGTALALASLKGHAEIIEKLVKNGEDPDEIGYFGKTPLILASCEDHADAVDTLLRLGADPNLPDRIGGTALAAALFNTNSCNEVNRHRIVKSLIRGGADMNQHAVIPMPAKPGSNPIRAFCVSDTGRNWPLSYAIDTGYVSLVRILLLAGSYVPPDELDRCRTAGCRFFDADELLAPVVVWTGQPRSLQHASRAVVRRSVLASVSRAREASSTTPIGQFGCVRRAIESLPVADRLRAYIDFAEFDDISIERATLLRGAEAGLLQQDRSTLCGTRPADGASVAVQSA